MCLDAVNRAVSSRASDCKEFSRSRLTTPESASNSNHNMLSSASSTTTPSFAANSARDLARHVALQFAATEVPLRSSCLPMTCASGAWGNERYSRITRKAKALVRSRSSSGVGTTITNYKSQITNSYRSISPSTISMLPIAATTSAISRPSHILGSNCKFARHADRTCTRYGFAVPSLTM